MSLLGAFGRSNAYNVGKDLISQAREYGQMPLRAEEANTRNIVLSQQVAARQQDMALRDMQIKQEREKQERDNKLVDSEDLLARDPNAGKFVVDKMREHGLVQDVDTPMGKKTFIRSGDYQRFKTEILPKDYEASLTLGWQRYATLDQAKVTAANALQKAREKGDPAAIQQAEKAYTDAKGAAEQLGASLVATDRKIQEALTKKKDDETYTLPPGAKRYDSKGNVIADNPKEEPVLTPYQKETLRIQEEKLRLQKEVKDNKKLSLADQLAIKEMNKQIPKSKTAAQNAVKNLSKIDRMLDLIDKGAGGVRGELMAKINRVTDLIKVTSPDSSKYNTLVAELRGFAGQLRVQLGIIGMTTDRDMEIMYQSAGGNSPAESQRAILEAYREGFVQDITNFNMDAETLAQVPGATISKNAYKPIPIPERKAARAASSVPPDLPQGTVNNGDGTFTLPSGQKVRPKK